MTALRYEEVSALGRLYFHWESGRRAPSYREMERYAREPRMPVDKAKALVDGLIAKGLAAVEGEGEPDERPIRITPEGVEWFERNVDYWRDCNRYRISPLYSPPVPPEAGVPRSVAARLRDPLVPGAAAFGAALALLLTRWFS